MSEEPIITHEQLAAANFEAWPDYANLKDRPEAAQELEQNLSTILENLRTFSRVAVSLVGFSKPDLIGRVKRMDEHSEGLAAKLLVDLTNTTDQARFILKVVETAETRLAVAIANTCDEDHP